MASESKALVSAPIAVDSKQFSSPSADLTGHDDKRVRRPSIGFWRWAALVVPNETREELSELYAEAEYLEALAA